MSVVQQGLPPAYSETVQMLVTSNSAEINTPSSKGEATEGSSEDEKRAIYGHPLFPLMALLFEKCEQASQSADCPSSDSFDVDIQAFVHHQEKDRKPFFSEDPELDGLMLKAIQVLRIHLLELEKVNELCKDFCNRYIACLKGKLQSEQLLRIDSDFDDPPFEEGSPPNSNQGNIGIQPVVNTGNNMMLQQGLTQPAVATLNQGQIVSGGTVYQMVQTPQGLVAQPIQIQTPVQTQIATTPVIHGSTPLSQIGVASTQTTQPSTPTVSTTAALSAQLSDSDSDDMSGGKKKNKRGVLPKSATQIMKSWLFQHIVHPYPTEDEKRQIASQTNLTLLQVNNWFINARRRILQPMLDASNPEQSKAKKPKTQHRPVQRFWPESIANIQPQLPPGLAPATPSSEEKGETTNNIQTSQQSQIVFPDSVIGSERPVLNEGSLVANIHTQNRNESKDNSSKTGNTADDEHSEDKDDDRGIDSDSSSLE